MGLATRHGQWVALTPNGGVGKADSAHFRLEALVGGGVTLRQADGAAYVGADEGDVVPSAAPVELGVGA